MDLSNTLNELKLIASGDHMVLLYDNDTYNAEISAAYIASRVIRNEKCIYIAGDDDQDLLIEKLGSIIDIKKVLAKGQVTILSHRDAYSKEGNFKPDNMIALIKALSLEAIEEGYQAFAITGEVSWVLDDISGFEKIMDYEYQLNNKIFGNYPVSAVCRYNLNKFSSQMIRNIIEVHPIIIWEGQIHHNPFYFDTIDTSEVDIHEYQVKAMLNTITSFTNTKSRFYNQLMAKENENQMLQLNLMENIILSLTSLLEIHDEYTKNHSENVANIAKNIARAMSLPKEEISKIYFAGLVHDIGKTVIPYDIINKKSKLTNIEFDIIKKHSSYGYEALYKTDTLKFIAELVLHHHERIDGTGYPSQKSGEDIPLGSRILCIADSYDSMVSDRPYRSAMSQNDAFNELKSCAGSQFDEAIVDIFIEKVAHDFNTNLS